MHISWDFLNKRQAAINAVEDYGRMKYIIDHTDEEIMKIRNRMESMGGGALDGMPHGSNPSSTEDRIIDGIEEIDTLKERYRRAVEYMSWFKPAWDFLSEDERYVLSTFHMAGKSKNAVDIVSDHFNIERSSVYVRHKRAAKHLATLLYGTIFPE